ncbi:MAG: AAA family ATPase [Eubacterium sp.]|nr:AAA family ATPase [Eubacterium sp.]
MRCRYRIRCAKKKIHVKNAMKCIDSYEKIGKYFEPDIHVEHIISVLEKYYQVKIVPEETLIIFDEIQLCERALTSLKYFSEEAPEYHVMAAGSQTIQQRWIS